MTLAAGTPVGKYIVRRKLAEGGMAEIYLCSSVGPEGFEKEVVIKRIREGLAQDPGFVQMFISEARLASRLNHPNVVHIYDFDKHDDTYYLAMEYVRGASLYDLRKRCKELMEPIGPLLAAQIALEVARGLGYAHRLTDAGRPLNLVHRDVTPHNVLLSFEGAVKLTDFGIARAGSRLTSAGTLKGKFAYMSPEQARGEDVDSRTDLFALGIVLWEMLTGGRLFDADSDVAVLRAVQQSAIPAPRRLNPDVPETLDAIVVKALERDPEKRFESAYELERALGQFLLKSAQRVEDTDVASYLRKLFPDDAAREGTRVSRLLPSDPPRPVREPTAVMKKTPGGGAVLSPDEDPHASTLVFQRRLESAAPAASLPGASPSDATPRDSSVPTIPTDVRKGRGAPQRILAIAGAAVTLVVATAAVVWKARGPTDSEQVAAASSPSRGGDPAAPTAPVRPRDGAEAPRAQAQGAPGSNGASPTQPGAATGTTAPSSPPPPSPATSGAPPKGGPPPSSPVASEAGSAAATVQAEAAPATGKLRINAMPWATVTVEGHRPIEVEGYKVLELAPGKYTLRMQRGKQQATARVTVHAGKTAVHTVKFPRR